MNILHEDHYRSKIKPEHWDEYVDIIAKANLAAPTVSVQAAAKLDAYQAEAAWRLMAKYSDDYPLSDGDGE